MFYIVEWIEEEKGAFSRVYRAETFREMWLALSYMNMERKEKKRPVMKRIRIMPQETYDGAFFEITGDYEADLSTDSCEL